ncbi:MAG: Streptogramin lyase [Haloplasmataceae bacterium]|jgi:tetratricopeptide (TPR) repeat protein|nr:Streptogramin lyase [Haloplasmataceae bacterium]
MKKNLIFLMLVVLTLLLSRTNVNASNSYNYTPLGDVIESANSMSAAKIIDNSNLLDANGNKSSILLGELSDVVVYEDKIYVADLTYNHILVLNNQYQVVDTFPKVIVDDPETTEDDATVNAYKLNKPSGLYIRDGKLYVADTENKRVVIFDIETKEIILEVSNPQDPTFEGNTTFKPLKIAVDRTGRMFVIAFGIFEGIMDFNPDGSFSRFYGTNSVSMNFFEALVYKLSSEAQREKQSLKLQSSFVNIDIDQFGYVYTVSKPEVENVIKKINFKGADILNKNGYVLPVGDAIYEEYDDSVPVGKSNIVDVAVSADGYFYSILDSRRGRVFSYDNEGNLLYIFGQLGSQSSMFRQPTSLTYYNNNIIVTDNMNKSIIVFEPTPFGDLINQATTLYLQAKYSETKELWEEVLKLNSNYFLAYNGIGKAQLREGNYEDAMINLELGHDQYNYSKAFEQYRNEKLDNVLPYVLMVAFLGLGFLFYKSLRNSIEREKEGGE